MSAQGSQGFWEALINNKLWEKDDVQCRGRVFGVLTVALDFVCLNPKPFTHPRVTSSSWMPGVSKGPGKPALAHASYGSINGTAFLKGCLYHPFYKCLRKPMKSNCINLHRSRLNNPPWEPSHNFSNKKIFSSHHK